ncbi:M48 family metallopeptidase [Chengkuizengella marina]|uniref:Peptidase M48 domain-containing protein n=1 Tax=Chengkuizengella marina TaxID=2507566 RepID=A0A6N9Q7Y6_9BACL|nr:M48 family metalloprotease [Chengkuizengella marina]NBI30962.1 hypothetical protein [Chengkuizengella marina]
MTAFNNRELIEKSEKVYFFVAAFISICLYIVLFFSFVFIPIIVGLFLFMMFAHWLNLAMIRNNGVKIGAQQFPELYDIAAELCSKMGIKTVPEIYIMESSGILNAFATRYFGRNMVVMYSEIVELIEKEEHDELRFIIAHELAHIQRSHISKDLLIMGAKFIPFLSSAYSRACEYTCDRFAAHYTNHYNAAKNGLTILAVGKKLYRTVNHESFLKQISEDRGFFTWLSEKLSTHPTLPKRIHSIADFLGKDDSDVVHLKKSNPYFWIMVSTTVLVLSIIFLTSLVKSSMWENLMYKLDGTTPLIYAIEENDISKIEHILQDQSIDVNELDQNGLPALAHVLYNVDISSNNQIIKLILEAGGDPNFRLEEDYNQTLFMDAIGIVDTETLALFISSGADLETTDLDGWTPLLYAIYIGELDKITFLLESGASIQVEDRIGVSILEFAEEYGNEEVINVLQMYGAS